MLFIYIALFAICIVALIILVTIISEMTNTLLSRSLSMANAVALLLDNAKIEPQKTRFKVTSYGVYGTYKGRNLSINLHAEFVTIAVYVSEKLPKQNPFFMYNPKYNGTPVRIGKHFCIHFKQSAVLEKELFSPDKFLFYIEKIYAFIEEQTP